jgi:hypothetical protein
MGLFVIIVLNNFATIISPFPNLWNGRNYDYHGGISTGKMDLSPCKHWRIWRSAGSWAKLDAIKADGVDVEVGIYQRGRDDRRIAREQTSCSKRSQAVRQNSCSLRFRPG